MTKQYWRMSLKVGNQGPSVWPECNKRGIVAIGYWAGDKIIVGDCSKYTVPEYKEIWRKTRPRSGTAQASLKYFAYEMKKGDVIYIKDGPYIAAKGTIKSKYKYNIDILRGCVVEDDKIEWPHYRMVKWDNKFVPFRHLAGAEPCTVLKLEGDRLSKIIAKENKVTNDDNESKYEALEGKRIKAEVEFRTRNKALIRQAKRASNYRCQVCNMSYQEEYGNLGKEHIIAHHIKPIRARKKASKTTLNDIALVCANCHDMLHRKNPPITVDELKKWLKC